MHNVTSTTAAESRPDRFVNIGLFAFAESRKTNSIFRQADRESTPPPEERIRYGSTYLSGSPSLGVAQRVLGGAHEFIHLEDASSRAAVDEQSSLIEERSSL